ncbi:hypothetical protein ACFLU6_11960, partial [Acidobacteriota bacterium]
VFFARQAAWRQGGMFSFSGFASFFRNPKIHTWQSSLIDVSFAVLCLLLLILAWRKLPLWLNIYTLIHLIPMVTSTLLSMTRFTIILFPITIGLAALTGESRWRNVILCSFPLLQGFFMVLFANWYWVG